MSIVVIGVVVIFVLTYIGIISKKIPRTTAAMGGAIGMLFWGIAFNFYGPEKALTDPGYVDFNTIGLLLGMMILVGLLGETGAFEYLAIKTAKLSKGSYYRLLAFLVLVTAFTSAFLDNVTTVLLMAPVTITIAKELDINPVPFLMVEIVSSNIGGTMTLIGDPPNVMIGSAGGIHFVQFLIYLAPLVIIVLLVVLLYFELLFKDILESDMENFEKIAQRDENECISNWSLLYKSLFALLITMGLFTVHHLLNLEPWMVAVFGASLLLLLSLPDPEVALDHVHWSTLLFFVSLFIVIGGLVESGIIRWIAMEIEMLSGGSLLIALFLVLMISGAFAIVVGNIPAAIILVSVVSVFTTHTQIGAGYPINPLWWALSMGACFGGNGTLISAPANLIVSNISGKMGHPITFRKFTKYSLPLTALTLFLSFVLLWFFFIVLM